MFIEYYHNLTDNISKDRFANITFYRRLHRETLGYVIYLSFIISDKFWKKDDLGGVLGLGRVGSRFGGFRARPEAGLTAPRFNFFIAVRRLALAMPLPVF